MTHGLKIYLGHVSRKNITRETRLGTLLRHSDWYTRLGTKLGHISLGNSQDTFIYILLETILGTHTG